MIRIRQGRILRIVEKQSDLQLLEIKVEGEVINAVHFPQITGSVSQGQRVIVNSTARSLNLGTGGTDFIIYAEGNDYFNPTEPGHIIKLRYTPYQIKVLSVEEENSPYHQILQTKTTLDGMPVLVAPLHSMIPAIIAVFRELAPDFRIVYLMSDGGALPLSLSNLIRDLKKKNWLAGTITFGHAFGGDLEAVNVYSALLAAKWVLNADIAIISMGPGIVGTGTPYGFTGVEQANFLHAAHILQGCPIAIPRISFADQRPRHLGLSHHSLKVLGELTLVCCQIGLPQLNNDREIILQKQVRMAKLYTKHQISYHQTEQIERILSQDGLNLRTMGRGFTEEREFFITAGIGSLLAFQISRLHYE